MKDWQGQEVAELKIAGAISGTTDKPSAVTIAPGGSFTGTALYNPELGMLVEQSLSGNYVTQEGAGSAAVTVSNTFSRVFKVTGVMGAGEMAE
jgi:hypothetical protein